MRENDVECLRIARELAKVSSDPLTGVGCVIANNGMIAKGVNRMPFRTLDSYERWNDRISKLTFVVHAEMDALINASKSGVSTDGAVVYIVCTDHSSVYGSPPCTQCTKHLIHAGVSGIVTLPRRADSKWAADADLSLALLREAAVDYREVAFP